MAPRQATTILWFRNDLRLRDNPALQAALDRDSPTLAVFIWSPEEEKPWSPGGASQVWLHHSLAALKEELHKRKSQLFFFKGPAQKVLKGIVEATQAGALFYNRRYEAHIIKRDKKLQSYFKGQGLEVKSFNSHLLVEPWEVATQEENPYKVFTPFWKAIRTLPFNEPHPAPREMPAPPPFKAKATCTLKNLNLLPKIKWDEGITKAWEMGELAAQRRWRHFLDGAMERYHQDRDRPDLLGTSRLSPHLHFGEISPRQLWHDVHQSDLMKQSGGLKQCADKYLAEVGWREFAYHLLYHFPHTTKDPLQEKFKKFPWRNSKKDLKAWQLGETGFPLVDAGMRELWHTGYMHNRVRMIVASFLVKDLRLHWLEGAKWFWDTLVDADLASNTLGWQWAAGCGADAAPFFRIFNPTTQAEKFDPKGEYIKKWISELADTAPDHIHAPHKAAEPPKDYPEPIIDHAQARHEALEIFKGLS